jgi:hypothetical protein
MKFNNLFRKLAGSPKYSTLEMEKYVRFNVYMKSVTLDLEGKPISATFEYCGGNPEQGFIFENAMKDIASIEEKDAGLQIARVPADKDGLFRFDLNTGFYGIAPFIVDKDGKEIEGGASTHFYAFHEHFSKPVNYGGANVGWRSR